MKNVLFVLTIPSVLILLLTASLLMLLTVNTSQAFTPQQPSSSAAGQQQQQLPQAPQASQLVSTQQNTTQSNQSAPLPPPQQQQKIPLNQSVVSENFTANGTIDSIIYTTNGNWKGTGIWTLTVSEGELTSFAADMAWGNGTANHKHEFQNFVMDDDSDNVSIDPGGTVTMEGDMDVATNGVVTWPSVPAEITIDQGKIITVSLDHEDTDYHFGGHDQAIHGTVTSLKPCSVKPGPNMQILTDAC
jgi:glucose/arabinose dehydrogenase